jgi:hypothetical protein
VSHERTRERADIFLFVTPIYMVTNTVSYVKALRNLPGAPE